MAHRKHVAWVSLGQFSPRLGVGGLHSSLTRLQYLQAQGYPVSILDFLPSDHSHLVVDQLLAERGGGEIHHDGSTCRTTFLGVRYRQQVLPVPWEQMIAQQQPSVGAVLACLQREGVEYAFTYDEGYWPLQAAWRARVPGAHFFQTVDDVRRFARYPGYIWLLGKRTVVASSRFMQEQIKVYLGLESVLWYPFVDVGAYRCQRTRERTRRIGFCSTSSTKGSEIVAEIAARLPERRFLVVGNYNERPADNLTHWGYIADMRRFYGEIDLLLVPSLRPEAYGRVIIEAAVNGIPSIANRSGGIPEALADSGVLIEWEPDVAAVAERYVEAIRRLLDDEALYAEHRQKALARAVAYEREQLEMSHEFRQRYIG